MPPKPPFPQICFLLLALLVVGCANPSTAATTNIQVPTTVTQTTREATGEQPAPTAPVAASAPTANVTEGCVDSYDESVNAFPETATFEVATGVTIAYHNHYKVIQVTTPWRDAAMAFAQRPHLDEVGVVERLVGTSTRSPNATTRVAESL